MPINVLHDGDKKRTFRKENIGTLSINKTGQSTGQTFGEWGHFAVKKWRESALCTFRLKCSLLLVFLLFFFFNSFQELFFVLNRKLLGTSCWSTKSSLFKLKIVSINKFIPFYLVPLTLGWKWILSHALKKRFCFFQGCFRIFSTFSLSSTPFYREVPQWSQTVPTLTWY